MVKDCITDNAISLFKAFRILREVEDESAENQEEDDDDEIAVFSIESGIEPQNQRNPPDYEDLEEFKLPTRKKGANHTLNFWLLWML